MDSKARTIVLTSRLSRRAALRGALGLFATPLLQACQPAAPPLPAGSNQQAAPTSAPTSAPTAAPKPAAAGAAPTAPTSGQQAAPAAAGTPKRGGTLNVVVQNDWVTMDSLYASAPLNGAYMLYGFWVLWGRDAKTGEWGPQPDLLAEWDPKPNELTLKLQKGVTFHDGTPWDGAAAKWNLDRMIFDPASSIRGWLRGVDVSKEDKAALDQLKQTAAQTFDFSSKAVEVVDDSTVKVHLERPIAPIMNLLSNVQQFNCPVSPTAYKKLGKVEFGRNPVGAGPFRFVEWKSGDHITMERNPDYWKRGADGKSLPYVDRVVVRLVVDDSVRLLEVKSGNAALTELIQGKDIAGVQSDPNLTLIQSETTGNAYRMIFDSTNTDSPFNKSLKLRQAMLYAMDRDAMVKTLGFGAGYGMKFLETKASSYYDESMPYYWYDKAKSEQLLKEAIADSPGLAGPDGKVAVTLTAIQRAVDQAQAEMIKQMAEAVGFKVTIEILERAAWTAKLVKRPDQPGGKFDFATMRNGPTVADPDSQWRNYFHSLGGFNVAHLDDPAWDKQIEAATATYDLAERKKLYRQLDQMSFDQAWYGWLWIQNYNWVHTKALQGYREPAGTYWMVNDSWMA